LVEKKDWIQDERRYANEIAFQYDEGRKLYLPYKQLQIEKIIQRIREITNKDSLVLEVGCGTGNVLYYLKNLNIKVVGIDISQKMIEIAKTKIQNYTNCELMVADATRLPFRRNTFDVVYYICVLHHLPDLTMPLIEADRTLKQGGTIYIEEPLNNKVLDFFRKFGFGTKIKSPHERGFYFSDLSREIGRTHFVVSKYEFKVFLGYFLAGYQNPLKITNTKLAKFLFKVDTLLSQIPFIRSFAFFLCLQLKREDCSVTQGVKYT
jgi:ubiquinone/menaquinone biosynthesis C-methylase UbiE